MSEYIAFLLNLRMPWLLILFLKLALGEVKRSCCDVHFALLIKSHSEADVKRISVYLLTEFCAPCRRKKIYLNGVKGRKDIYQDGKGAVKTASTGKSYLSITILRSGDIVSAWS